MLKKLAYFLKNLQTSRANNSRILSIKNAKFSGYCFYININTYRDFQICISVPLITPYKFMSGYLYFPNNVKNIKDPI